MRVSRGNLPRRPSLLTALVFAHVLVLVAVLLPGVGGSTALAQSSDDLREEQEAIEAQLDQAREVESGVADELQDAAEVRAEVEGDLASATARVDEVLAEIERVEDDQAALQAEVDALEAEAQAARDSLGAQIRQLYITSGAADSFVVALNSNAAGELGVRSHYLEALARTDRAEIETLGTIATTLQARQADLERVTADLDTLRVEAEDAQSALDRELFIAAGVESEVAQRLVDAESEARRLANEADAAAAAVAQAVEREEAEARAAEAARQAAEAAAAAAEAAAQASASAGGGASAAPVDAGGKACPQDNPRSFTDTWGAPRSGGRRHQGTDIFGTRGGNVFAIVDGTVAFTRTGGISGLFLGLQGDDGNLYYYIHLQDFVASPGQRVSAGELIGHNGDTGNARGTTPHIHFEVHPGGGAAVNPYPLLRAVCG